MNHPSDAEPPFLIFGSPLIEQAEIDEVIACMESSWLGTGPRVARFERDFAAYQGLQSAQVAAVNSCTAALHVSMVALDLPPGSEVITTPMTFCATVNAIIHAGLTPVLADVDPATQCIDPAAIEAAITPRTRAILPVHFAGRACDMDAIMAIARKHDLRVIEDCAHAIETTYHGRKAGTFGDFGCFSFYATKNVVTGEGGMIVGRSEAYIARTRVLALHGMSKDAWHRFGDEGYKHYQVVEAGFKYNMMDLQAAIGIHQLARVERNWRRREAIWNRYLETFKDLPIGLPAPVADLGPQRHAKEDDASPLPSGEGARRAGEGSGNALHSTSGSEPAARESEPSPLPLSRGERGPTSLESSPGGPEPSPLSLSRGERGSTSPGSSLRESAPSPLPLSRGERGSTSPESSLRESAPSPLPLSRGERGSRHAYHLFTIMVDEARCGISRDAFLDAMNKRRIGTGVHYLSIPEHPYYQQRYGWRPEQWPHAMRIGRQTVSLPLSPKLTDADVERVIEAVRALA